MVVAQSCVSLLSALAIHILAAILNLLGTSHIVYLLDFVFLIILNACLHEFILGKNSGCIDMAVVPLICPIIYLHCASEQLV